MSSISEKLAKAIILLEIAQSSGSAISSSPFARLCLNYFFLF